MKLFNWWIFFIFNLQDAKYENWETFRTCKIGVQYLSILSTERVKTTLQVILSAVSLEYIYIYIYISFFIDEFGFEWSNIRFLCADGGQIGVSLNWHSVGIVTWNTTLWPLALPLTPNILHSDLDLPNWVMWQRFSTISTTPSEGWTSSNSSQRLLRGGTSDYQFNLMNLKD